MPVFQLTSCSRFKFGAFVPISKHSLALSCEKGLLPLAQSGIPSQFELELSTTVLMGLHLVPSITSTDLRPKTNE
jgi:hypothetical protein